MMIAVIRICYAKLTQQHPKFVQLQHDSVASSAVANDDDDDNNNVFVSMNIFAAKVLFFHWLYIAPWLVTCLIYVLLLFSSLVAVYACAGMRVRVCVCALCMFQHAQKNQ